MLRDPYGIEEDFDLSPDEVLIFGPEPPPSELDLLLDRIMSGIMAKGSPLGPYLDARKDAMWRLGELMGMKPPQRRKAVRRRPYRDLLVAKVLLEESEKTQPGLLDLSVEMAQLAGWIADQPHPEERVTADEIRVRARCLEGNACRLRQDWKGAEERFLAALCALPAAASPATQADLYKLVSALREDQHRLDEATALLWKAAQLYCDAWFGGEGYTCLAQIGFIYLKQDDILGAMTALEEVRSECISAGATPEFAVKVDLGRAICLAAFGLHEQARCILEETLPLRRQIHDRDKRVPLEWLECRIAVRLGDLEKAIPRLEAIRRRFLDRKLLVETCLCSIDLALAYAKAGLAHEHFSLLLKDIARLPGATEHIWPLGSLRRFQEALDSEAMDMDSAARESADLVRRRETSLASIPPPGAWTEEREVTAFSLSTPKGPTCPK